jgi:hypothetical protein
MRSLRPVIADSTRRETSSVNPNSLQTTQSRRVLSALYFDHQLAPNESEALPPLLPGGSRPHRLVSESILLKQGTPSSHGSLLDLPGPPIASSLANKRPPPLAPLSKDSLLPHSPVLGVKTFIKTPSQLSSKKASGSSRSPALPDFL